LTDFLNQVQIKNQLLTLISCLETLLTPKDVGPIGNAIAEGLALIIADDVENRIA